MGIKALVFHASGSNHLKNVKYKQETQNFISKATTLKISQSETEKHPSSGSTQPDNPTASSSKSASSSTMSIPYPNKSAQKSMTKPFLMQQTIINYILDSGSLTAEIVRALKCVMHNYSCNSNCDMNEIVRVMFPNSNISNHYQMDANKIRYLINWGLAPYLRDKLVEDVNRSKFLSVIVCTSRVFNPILIDAENKLSLMKMMKSLTQQLHMFNIINANISDNSYEQYEDFIQSNFNSILYKHVDRFDDLFLQTRKIE